MQIQHSSYVVEKPAHSKAQDVRIILFMRGPPGQILPSGKMSQFFCPSFSTPDDHENANRTSGHNFLICLSLPRIFREILS